MYYVDTIVYSYMIEHNKIFDYYNVKRDTKLVFNDNQYCGYFTSSLNDNKTMISW